MTLRKPTYGRLELRGDRWILSDIPPHVAIRLKSVFAGIPKTQTKVFDLPASEAMSADLAWFESRYCFDMTPQDRAALENKKRLFEEDRAATEAILLPDWQPPARHGLRPGFDLYHYQKQAVELWLKRKSLLVGDETGLGKEQPLTAKLLTPSGWTAMGDAYVGMPIVGKDGKTHHVTGIYPQGVKPAYRISFTDGSSTECGLDHIWKVRDHNRRMRGRGWTTKTLRELIGHGIRYKSGATKWEIPLVDAVEFEPQGDLPIHPYLLGALIGDGYLSGCSLALSAPDSKSEILERVRTILGPERVTGPHGSVGSEQWHLLGQKPLHNEMKRYLKDVGLAVKSPQRFIPDAYMKSSPHDRMELLRGLMDTDGSSVRSRIIFHTCSEQLAYNVVDLVRSLGGAARARAYDRSHQGKPTEWQVNVRIHDNPFHLAYKAAGWNKCESTGRARRYIQSVEYVGDVEQQCISVSAPDSLYVTDDFTVTHNTLVPLGALAGSPYLPAAIVVQSHLPTQWVNEYIKKFTYMQAHIIQGTKPYNLPPANLYVFKYSNIAGWVDLFATGFFKAVVYDEIQELRRGEEAEKGKAALVLSQNVSLRLGLSASPVYNLGSEMFNVLRYIDPDVLGPWEEFCREWCVMASGGKWAVKDPDALGSYLRESGVFIRRLKQGRPINKIPIEVDYDEEIAENADALARQLAIKVMNGSFIEAGSASRELDAFARLQTGLAKAHGVAAIAKMYLEKGIPIILGLWHRDLYTIMREQLRAYRPVMYTGSETAKQKDRAKESFINGDSDCFLISLRSGAGLDGLQKRCSTLIVGELDWSNAVLDPQLVGRIDRPGQKADEITMVFPYVNYGSDPVLMRVNAIKRDQQRGINDPGAVMQPVHTDESRIKMLAKQFLEKDVA